MLEQLFKLEKGLTIRELEERCELTIAYMSTDFDVRATEVTKRCNGEPIHVDVLKFK
jgi:hypothetical protein